ncbi:hypothetical protein [Marinoscillum sp. MHG1-6]|uniref:hypothetical protein n=1 Tax=Marinoscillum sp. MHG1-6 TaxID=2959627 RepID=UPI002157B3CD|nr:hypothetical protein [Marinoscillum sp. MHG1-6]
MEVFDQSALKTVLMFGDLMISLSIFTFLGYAVQVISFRSRTDKYKFVSEKESGALKVTAVLLAGSISFYSFVLMGLSINISETYQYFFVGLFGLIVGSTLGYGLWSFLSFYHPFILEKRLKDIRFHPMNSPVTGKPMMLLNETQEDAHLSQEMIEEEDNFSVDYDVWVDEESDFKVIERYNTRFHPQICESCNFRTLTEKKQEIIEQPQLHQKGVLRKHYECSYCGHREHKDVEIASWDEESKYTMYEKDIVEIPANKISKSETEEAEMY